jgi:hypothetical protein
MTSPICSVRSPRPPNPVGDLDSIDETVLGRLRQARAAARERAWLARTELGRVLPTTAAGRRVLPGLVIDIDASLVTCHLTGEKESAAATFKGSFGYHPLLAFLDKTGEALAGLLRPGATPAATPRPTTSRRLMWRWPRSPTPSGMVARSWSGSPSASCDPSAPPALAAADPLALTSKVAEISPQPPPKCR